MIIQHIHDYLAVFTAGVIVSFTPCVYPLVPVVASVIGRANISGTKRAGFILSCVYVLGTAVSYSALGIIAALTGRLFGHLHNTPYLFFLVAVFLIFFSFVMVDIISFPALILKPQRPFTAHNVFGIFLTGLVSGLVIGPCTAPALGTILLYVGSKQNFLHAISLLFVFAYGVGFSLIMVGTGSGLCARLPKPGPWLIVIRNICAGLMFLTGLFFLVKAVILLRFS